GRVRVRRAVERIAGRGRRGGGHVEDVLHVQRLDAVRELVDQAGDDGARGIVVRVRGPTGVDLGVHVARVDALHDDLPRRLADAVLHVAVAELLLVIVEVDL